MRKFEPKALTDYSDAAILAELRRVAALVAAPCLTRAAFDAHARVAARRFGSWQAALARAGLAGRYCAGAARVPCPSVAELTAELRRVARKLGRTTLTHGDIGRHARVGVATFRRRFGSWRAALAAAGLAVYANERRFSDDDLFANLLAGALERGLAPRGLDPWACDQWPGPRAGSRISVGTYVKRFGGIRPARAAAAAWAAANGIAPGTRAARRLVERERRACQEWAKRRVARDRAGSRPGPKPALPPPADAAPASPERRPGPRMPGKTVPPRRRPKVHLGLRFRILERDRFRCRACGRSPANHLDCELHVDHIVPVAQGGTNAPENLRTLCADCNWGRGAGRKKLRRRGRRAKRQHDRGRRSRKSRP